MWSIDCSRPNAEKTMANERMVVGLASVRSKVEPKTEILLASLRRVASYMGLLKKARTPR